MARITDEQLVSICIGEISASSGYLSGELSKERAQAMDYYLGEPYGDEVDGRSQIRTREVLDTVESMVPSLMRIYADAENLFEFDPVGPDDDEKAQQETDRVSNAFWKQNRGFYNLQTFVKDALLSKTGNLKIWWEDAKPPEREEYQGLNEYELSELMNDTTYEREILELEASEETGLYDVVFSTVKQRGQVRIEPVVPEEFGVRRNASSPYAQDLQFCWQRTRNTYSELIAAGYDKRKIEQLPTYDDVETEERLSRRHLSDESDWLDATGHKSSREYWITECYIYVDRNDDDIAELLKVTIGSGSQSAASSAALLDVEEVDAIPFFTASPILLTHKFYGLSVADLCMDLQEIKSSLVRSILDNAYLANNQEKVVNDRANIDDLLTSRPGGIKRVTGEEPVQHAIAALQSTPLPGETFGLLEYMDELRKDRTGAGDEVPGLDAKSLASVNSSVAAIAYDQARARIELIARNLAEIALRPAFKRIHELLQKNQDKAEIIKIRGEWVEVNPSEWRDRENMTVQVGLGIASRERRLVALDAIAERQSQVVSGGGFGTLLGPEHLYQQLHDHAEALGVDPAKYYQDPRKLPPKPPEGPSPQEQAMMMTAQAQVGAAQAQNDRNKVDMMKAQADVQIRQMELAASQRELELKRQTEALKGDLAELKSQRDTAEKQSKTMLDAEIKVREQEIKLNDQRLKDAQEQAKRQVDVFKAMLQASTTLSAEQVQQLDLSPQEPGPSVEEIIQNTLSGVVDSVSQEFSVVRDELNKTRAQLAEEQARRVEAEEQKRAPKVVKRDANGLMVAIGDVPVVRDESGRVVSIG